MKPLKLFSRICRYLILAARESWLKRIIDNGGGRIRLSDPFFHVKVRIHPKAHITVRGTLGFERWGGRNGTASIILSEGSRLEINGDFTIGQGVTLFLDRNAQLTIGGRRDGSGSGITCDTIVMVSGKMSIGCDMICAWGCTITDSDWHYLEGSRWQNDVRIGDRVWIAHGSSILKGAHIGDGSIIASHSLVSGTTIPPHSMAAGIPAKIVRTGVQWSRDLPLLELNKE